MTGIPDPTNPILGFLERRGYLLGAVLMAVAILAVSEGTIGYVICLGAASALMLWKPMAASRRGFIQGWRGF